MWIKWFYVSYQQHGIWNVERLFTLHKKTYVGKVSVLELVFPCRKVSENEAFEVTFEVKVHYFATYKVKHVKHNWHNSKFWISNHATSDVNNCTQPAVWPTLVILSKHRTFWNSWQPWNCDYHYLPCTATLALTEMVPTVFWASHT